MGRLHTGLGAAPNGAAPVPGPLFVSRLGEGGNALGTESCTGGRFVTASCIAVVSMPVKTSSYVASCPHRGGAFALGPVLDLKTSTRH